LSPSVFERQSNIPTPDEARNSSLMSLLIHSFGLSKIKSLFSKGLTVSERTWTGTGSLVDLPQKIMEVPWGRDV
jgi:hypothetical protein